MITKNLISLIEHESKTIDSQVFTKDDIDTIKKFQDKVDIFGEFDENNTLMYVLKATQHVGYIDLPNHTIVINSKISRISFINMVKHALNLSEFPWDFAAELDKEENYYDILVKMFIHELENILQQGLLKGYQLYEDNVIYVKGKILFKENISLNYNRPDKVYCSFDELSEDIIENQIIKFVLHSLLQCYFRNEKITTKLIEMKSYLDNISFSSFTKNATKLIEHNPLNLRYRSILVLCDLFLQDLSIENRIGTISANSYFIDMNLLFEKFIISILKENSFGVNFEEQKKDFADLSHQLEFIYDIVGYYEDKPIFILDTKYKKFENIPESSDVKQLIAYSAITNVKNCGLIYPGNSQSFSYQIKNNINLHVIVIDLEASNREEFEEKLLKFKKSFYSCLLYPLSDV
jgi:5-methylcytosine-specific restriction enzyme subunit McrC